MSTKKISLITDEDLLHIWQLSKKEMPIEEFIVNVCDCFIGTPYELLRDPVFATTTLEQLLTCLAYEDEPEHKISGFDCVTFVETVLALVVARYCQDIKSFQKVFVTNLLSLRYYHGVANFLRRNYFFICVDWIPNNQWLVHDITKEISNTICYAKTYIDKLSWLYHAKLLEPYRKNLSLTDLATALAKLKVTLTGQESIIPYIKIADLLTNFNSYIKRFPLVSVVCIIRPDWNVAEVNANYGTHLNISHLGICTKKQDELYFYHANSINEQVVEKVKLANYLKKYLNHPTVRGINVLQCKF